ncbi:MAG: GDP-mannose 4,6-dehydratase [Halobacteriota archaeon]|jgi:UDP-glucose 4-epimerase
MSRVLVTGCAGFIGSHLVERLLARGDDVVGVDCLTDYYSEDRKLANLSQALIHKRFTFINRNILEITDFPPVNNVFHLAGQPGVRDSWGVNFATYLKNNVQTTQRLLEYYRGKELNSFVYASSSSVYGDAPLPMKEDSYLRPVSPYGVSKLAAENLCYLYWRDYDIPTVSLRCFSVYGPRQRPDMAIHRFVDAILHDSEIHMYGDGEQLRDFTYIGDVIEAFTLAALSECGGEVFNIAGGQTMSVNELIKNLENLIGTKARVRNSDPQRGEARSTWADITKAQRLLGWKPEIEMTNALQTYLSWHTSGSI